MGIHLGPGGGRTDDRTGGVAATRAAGKSAEWNDAAKGFVFVDFGMTGTLSPEAFRGLREGLLAFGTRDAPRLVRAWGLFGSVALSLGILMVLLIVYAAVFGYR